MITRVQGGFYFVRQIACRRPCAARMYGRMYGRLYG